MAEFGTFGILNTILGFLYIIGEIIIIVLLINYVRREKTKDGIFMLIGSVLSLLSRPLYIFYYYVLAPTDANG
ncbi:MAG: hypothetical protein JXR53_14925 [Bacteroidales bacterium]|nr:hypothetical protein [Bacteroidales bacterium]